MRLCLWDVEIQYSRPGVHDSFVHTVIAPDAAAAAWQFRSCAGTVVSVTRV